MIPMPDLITHKRPGSTFASDGPEIAAAPTIIETGIKAQINPASTNVTAMAFGPAEAAYDLIYLEAIDAADNLRSIHKGDWLIDEVTDDVWIAQQPGNLARNPVHFGAGRSVYDHIEVRVERKIGETMVLEWQA